jgi:uncharacterized coiled-coil protein SlyX
MSQPADNQPEKLNQIEEALGFLELQNGRSQEQFDELSKAVHELGKRMQRLESRLIDLNDRLETQDPGLVPPPHSAGPDISKDPL